MLTCLPNVIAISGKEFEIKTEYAKNRTSSVSIAGQVIRIRLAGGISRGDMLRQHNELLAWARKRIEKHPERFVKEKEQFKDAINIPLFRKAYEIRRQEENRRSITARLAGSTVSIKLPDNIQEEKKIRYANHVIQSLEAVLKKETFQ
ncbi:hypothetical protein HZB88_04660 [archaeon]|nr:hypothetical protein [archaeon]